MATQAGVGAESVVVNVGANQVPEPVKPAAAAGAAGSSAKWKWIIGITAVVVALGIGLGVGLGVGLKDKGEKVYTNIALDGTPGRTYFVAADTVLWDYAPSNKNMCYDDEYAANMTDSQFTRIGGKFYKAQYRQYTDSSFKTLAPRSDAHKHLGVLGPILYAEVGDVIRVVFKNNLDFAVNMVPYGLTLWQKEWASNNAVLRNSALNRVEPGQTVTYLWQVPPEAGPTNDQYAQSSRLWLYRSNVDPMRHDNAGLVGPVIVTAKGNAQPDGRAKDIDREFVAVYLNTFEAKSPYANVNLLNPIPGAETEGANNYKMSINGYIWCNQPGLDMNVGERVRWHIGSVGSIDAMHNFHWHGHTVMLQGHHMDQFSAIADATISADMIPDSAGTWMFHCHVNQHMDSGMVSLYNVRGTSQVEALPGATRNYYIQAEMIEWDYAGPNFKNMCGCQNLTECEGTEFGDDENVFMGGPSNGADGGPVLIGSKYYKAMYFEYTDANFVEKVDRAGLLNETYTGLVGPIIRAEVGDRIRIVLRNNVSFPITLHPHGVQYAKDSEGTRYEDGTSGNDKLDDYVLPGQSHTYTWNVRERSGPGPQDGSSIVWMYHSHAHETLDSYSGLVGAIIVNRKGAATTPGPRPNRVAKPDDVDEEIVVYYSVIDELSTHYIKENIIKYIGPEFTTEENFTRLAEDPGFMEHNLMHAINGYMYCNMPFLNFEAGKLVRVHFIMLGTLEDLHTPNMGGPHFNFLGSSVDSMIMAAGGMVSADAVFTQDGTYELNCQVADHVASGMRAKYSVVPGNVTITPTGRTRTYYISADTVDWDYAPGGVKKCTDKDFSQNGRDYAVQSKLHIGGKYVKAQYREYTDASFTTLKEVPSYYGIMGPIITAEVGDRITVVFRNNLQTRGEEIDDGVLDVNLMLGGSLIGYDGYDNAAGFAVMPGQNFTYQWIVPDESAPSKADFNSVVYAYTSTTDTVGWPSTGLVGMLHIVAQGQLDQTTMRPMGVDQVVPMYWMTMDENLSPWIGLSARNAGINPDTLLGTEVTDFENTNQKRAVNGKIFCNLDPVKMKSGTTVRWLQMAYGTEGGVHSVNFPGQKFRVDRRAAYTNPSLMPSIARVMDMSPGQPGTFPYFCGVHDHFEAGMMASMDITA